MENGSCTEKRKRKRKNLDFSEQNLSNSFLWVKMEIRIEHIAFVSHLIT